eukprot:6071634-Karenia_brevis.AAC.1
MQRPLQHDSQLVETRTVDAQQREKTTNPFFTLPTKESFSKSRQLSSWNLYRNVHFAGPD